MLGSTAGRRLTRAVLLCCKHRARRGLLHIAPVMQPSPQMPGSFPQELESPRRKAELKHILLRAVISLGPVLNRRCSSSIFW